MTKSLKGYLLNRLIDNNDRKALEPLINQMTFEIPEMMSRKIPEANVQQAFVLELILNLGNKLRDNILSVGSFECTATEFLKQTGWNIRGIDPVIDWDLHTFRQYFPDDKFNFVISVSVLEHVKNDELFIYDICKCLKDDGIALLTCDFKEDYKHGDPVPYSNYRLYTEYDINIRLRNYVESNHCSFINDTYWKGEPDFWYQGHRYNFASIAIQKKWK